MDTETQVTGLQILATQTKSRTDKDSKPGVNSIGTGVLWKDRLSVIGKVRAKLRRVLTTALTSMSKT